MVKVQVNSQGKVLTTDGKALLANSSGPVVSGILIQSDGSSNTGFILKSVGVTDVSAYQYMYNRFYIFGSAIDEIDLSSIKSISGGQAFAYSFQSLNAVTTATIGANSITGSGVFYYSFRNCTAITDIYFSSLKTASFGTAYKNQFQDMMSGTGSTKTHTLHFPSNLESTISTLTGYPLFGGTSGYVVLAFDLPVTE